MCSKLKGTGGLQQTAFLVCFLDFLGLPLISVTYFVVLKHLQHIRQPVLQCVNDAPAISFLEVVVFVGQLRWRWLRWQREVQVGDSFLEASGKVGEPVLDVCKGLHDRLVVSPDPLIFFNLGDMESEKHILVADVPQLLRDVHTRYCGIGDILWKCMFEI